MSIDDRKISSQFSERLNVAFDFNEPPATLGELATDISQLLEEKGIKVGLEELCTAESSRHKARIGEETKHFHCVLDALLLSFVVENQQEFQIESRSPISAEIIEIQITNEDIEVAPVEAFMSFGVEKDFKLPADGDISPMHAYNHLCPYINAFLSRQEYEQWDHDNPDAVTMGFPLTDGYQLALALKESPAYVFEDYNP